MVYETLNQALKDPDDKIVMSAIWILNDLGGADDLPGLVGCIKSENQDVRELAVHAIVNILKRDPQLIYLSGLKSTMREFVEGSDERKDAEREMDAYHFMITSGESGDDLPRPTILRRIEPMQRRKITINK